MDIPVINLKAQYKTVEKEILDGVKDILSEQSLILGKYCALLENTLSGYVGAPHAISCANGTDALILALMALGIKEGDEVITTPYTFFSTASSIALLGGRPVFVDVEERDLNIDPALIERAITEKTKAIIVVHLFGKVCDMDPILAVAKRHDIPLVEDMAQSLGARVGGRMSGNFGDLATVSFYPTKNLGGIGEGGLVFSTRPDLADKVKKLRVHGMGNIPYHHEMIGFNSRLDEIKACALVAKFPSLESWNRKRIDNGRFYNSNFGDLPIILPHIPEDFSHIVHQYVIRLDERDRLQTFLRERGIQTGIYYPVPLHMQGCFSHYGYGKGSCPVAEKAALTSLALPAYPELEEAEKDYIVLAVREFFKA